MNNQNFNNQNFNNNAFPDNREFAQNNEFTPDFGSVLDKRTEEGEKKASLSMTLGIVGLIMGIVLSWCCTVFSIAGIVLDIISIVFAGDSTAMLGYTHQSAKIGKTCAIIGLVLAVLGAIVSICLIIAIPILEANFAY